MSDTKWPRGPYTVGPIQQHTKISGKATVLAPNGLPEAYCERESAELFAAAAELYEVLYALLEDIDGSEEDRMPVSKRLRSDAIKALAKARGETCAS